MRLNLIIAVVLFIIAGVLFALPGDYLRRWRLELYGLYSGSKIIVDEFSNPIVLTSEVSSQRKIKELQVSLARKDGEIAFLKKELRQIREVKDIFPLLSLTSAGVINGMADLSSPEVVLDKGLEDGVVKGEAVAQGQMLAGVIASLTKKAALALLVDNPGCLIPGRSAKSRDMCSVIGKGYGKARAIFYTGHTVSMPGEKIFTSGLLGHIPEGLLIGTLEDYPIKGVEPGTLEAPVKLSADLASLERVLIIKTPEKEE